MPRRNKKVSSNRAYQRDEQSGRHFRAESFVPMSPKHWKPSRAALRSMERVYGKYWRDIDFVSLGSIYGDGYDYGGDVDDVYEG